MSEAGLRFECTGCGQCCTNRGEYAYVYLNDEEAQELADLLGLTTASFKRRYTFIDEDGWRQLSFVSDRCIFLDPQSGACKVYAARPTQSEVESLRRRYDRREQVRRLAGWLDAVVAARSWRIR